MPPITLMPPEATPRSIAILAPNSRVSVSDSNPSSPSPTSTEPPPPNSETVIRNGASCEAKLNRTRAGPSTNGMFSLAPNEIPSRLNTPTWMAGRLTPSEALIPVSSTVIDGPEPSSSGASAAWALRDTSAPFRVAGPGDSPPFPNPIEDRNSWSFCTNSRTPTNVTSVMAGSTFGFWPLTEEKLRWSNVITMALKASPTSWAWKSSMMPVISNVDSPGVPLSLISVVDTAEMEIEQFPPGTNTFRG